MKQSAPKRHRITVERRKDTLDGYGESEPGWTKLLTRFSASVRDDSQREYTATLLVQSGKSIHVEIRNPHIEINTKDRVIWHKPFGDKKLDIKSILAGDNVNDDLILICSEHSTE